MLRSPGVLLISLNVLGRAPIPGQAKTRLMPALGAEGAARAQCRLLQRVVGVGRRWCAAAPRRRFRLWCSPDGRHPFFSTLTDADTLRDQPTGDLGDRLAHVAARENGDGAAVLLLGADGVSVDEKLLDRAEAALEKRPAVLAAAEDGGYVMLGLKRVHEAVFRDIPWGGERVAAVTRQRMIELGWSWTELPEQWDVDTPADWNRFQQLPTREVQ